MTKHEMIVCILLAIVTTNLIRILPMVLIKGRIQNVFLRSFLYYVPYVTMAVMTFPAIVESTMSPYAGIAALLIGLVAAWRRLGLFPVACICCAVAYLIDAWLA